MHAFAFASKHAEGGAFLMTGDSLREALQKLEERSETRFIMGTKANVREIATCDTRFIHPAELRAISEVAEVPQ